MCVFCATPSTCIFVKIRDPFLKTPEPFLGPRSTFQTFFPLIAVSFLFKIFQGFFVNLIKFSTF